MCCLLVDDDVVVDLIIFAHSAMIEDLFQPICCLVVDDDVVVIYCRLWPLDHD